MRVVIHTLRYVLCRRVSSLCRWFYIHCGAVLEEGVLQEVVHVWRCCISGLA